MASAAVSFCGAVQSSLRRLGQSSVGLYQIHWPGFPVINNWATEAFVEGLANVQQAGLAKVGICGDSVAINNACSCSCACMLLTPSDRYLFSLVLAASTWCKSARVCTTYCNVTHHTPD